MNTSTLRQSGHVHLEIPDHTLKHEDGSWVPRTIYHTYEYEYPFASCFNNQVAPLLKPRGHARPIGSSASSTTNKDPFPSSVELNNGSFLFGQRVDQILFARPGAGISNQLQPVRAQPKGKWGPLWIPERTKWLAVSPRIHASERTNLRSVIC